MVNRDNTPPPKKGIEWSTINIGIKEFLAGIVFVASMSGVYYRLYYQQSEDKIKSDARFKAVESQLDATDKKVNTNIEAIKALKDAEMLRAEREKIRAEYIPYQPMKKVR